MTAIPQRWETDAVPGLSILFISSLLPVMQADALQCLTMSHKQEQTSSRLMYHGRAHPHILYYVREEQAFGSHIICAHIFISHMHTSLCAPLCYISTHPPYCVIYGHILMSHHISTHPCLSPCHADTRGPYRREASEPDTHLAAVPGSPAGWRSSPPASSRCCCSSSATALPHTGTCLPPCHWPG